MAPLWYCVMNRQLSFKEFLDRYHDKKFEEREVVPIFIFSVIYNHDPYVSGVHILSILIKDKGITERALKYIYLYWVIGKKFANDLMLSGNPISGTFKNINIQFPDGFTSDFIYDWIGIIIRSFFKISVYVPDDIKYERLNMATLFKSLEYVEELQENRFMFQEKTMERTYKLAVAHDDLKDLINFLKEGIFPKLLRSYRKDVNFVKNITLFCSPLHIKSIHDESPLTDKEIEFISKEHHHMYEFENIEFFIHYADVFIKIFDQDHILTKQIRKYLKPSNKNDGLRAEQFLRSLSPLARRKYIPQYVPVADTQLNRFLLHIQEKGIVNALEPYLLNNKKLIEEQLKLSQCELANNFIIANQCSIFLYSIDQLIFHTENNKLYTFLPEELSKIPDRINPFNRQSLPDYLFTSLFEVFVTENFEEVWSKIVRHTVNLQSIIENI